MEELKIKDMPYSLREWANNNHLICSVTYDKEKDYVAGFVWSDSIEGFNFWDDIEMDVSINISIRNE